jgi:hypothetical protein
VRRHDLSGCDYEGVCSIPRQVANAIADRGVAIPASMTRMHVGIPGVVVLDEPEGRIQVRADVGDPTTVIAECDLDPFTAAVCVADAPVAIRWVVAPEPA